ncbi:PTS sugar transporter subunit IIA [Rhizobium sp. SEMIA 4085]|uniref:PTS system nitrogen regulatory PtsN-like protein n=1 Tax=Rhizobium gallicum bv. gallicum R602sp TaxID=1041138 RepID=A0A0B4XDE6_9HYPH|nr:MULTISPECIES: PTS sugar transporter subunit IIA [Rhizobium]AJD44537.1 PTS system nitrogen regulatory PtsN-like protein [Rhizobium gallicum bv. gallicum R602sp]NNH32920.1 PTS sugar transporter subunit IIA [Rhizobium sp. SEMIA 4085]TDW25007.1 phosphotransferase IIA-like nitrogen-regulatory protein PtsN [Rhizobium azibense]
MIFKHLSEKDVTLDLVTKGKLSALSKIAVRIARRAGVDDQVVLRRLWKRESGGATGIGRGIAVPHALFPSISCPVASFTRLAAPINFGSPDGDPVDLVFTLLWPRSATATFLPALAQLCRLVRAPQIHEGLRLAQSSDEVMAILDNDIKATTELPISDRAAALVSPR